MRQIEKDMLKALEEGRSWKMGNTEVICFIGGERVYLHGNCIYYKDLDGIKHYQTCGWPTVTTRSRLRALGLDCQIKDGQIITKDGRVVPKRA